MQQLWDSMPCSMGGPPNNSKSSPRYNNITINQYATFGKTCSPTQGTLISNYFPFLLCFKCSCYEGCFQEVYLIWNSIYSKFQKTRSKRKSNEARNENFAALQISDIAIIHLHRANNKSFVAFFLQRQK